MDLCAQRIYLPGNGRIVPKDFLFIMYTINKSQPPSQRPLATERNEIAPKKNQGGS